MSEEDLKVAILIVSDTASDDPTTDKVEPVLREVISSTSQAWDVVDTKIVPDDVGQIQHYLVRWTSQDVVNLIITSGGTGFATKDVTPEVRSFHDSSWSKNINVARL
jgi:gephyrin